MFTRFSTVAGNKGSADLARDVRGFAVKFYTQQGNLPAISVPKLARQYNVKANQIFNWRRKMTDGSVLVASAEAATAAPFAAIDVALEAQPESGGVLGGQIENELRALRSQRDS